MGAFSVRKTVMEHDCFFLKKNGFAYGNTVFLSSYCQSVFLDKLLYINLFRQ